VQKKRSNQLFKIMGDIADGLVDMEMFGGGFEDSRKPIYKPRGNKKPKGKYRKTAYVHLTPAERKIASIRKEIAILVNEQGVGIGEARRMMNDKYGKGWRERGLVRNSDNQWTDEELEPFMDK